MAKQQVHLERRSRVGVLVFFSSLVCRLKLEAMTINGHHSPLGAFLLVVSNTKGKMLLMEATAKRLIAYIH